MTKRGDPHALRSIPDLLLLMEEVATRCEAADPRSSEDGIFERALRLAYEIRVPRMPDDERTLGRMLADAAEGSFLSTDEAFERLEQAKARSTRLRSQYRNHVACGRRLEAARMLCPSDGSMLSWTKDAEIETSSDAVGFVSVATGAHGTLACRSSCQGSSMLGLVMRMHVWNETWSR